MENLSIIFINSDSPWYKIHCSYSDALLDKGWLLWFLKEGGFPESLSEGSIPHDLLNRLRTLLADSLDNLIAGKTIDPAVLEQLNLFLSKSSLMYEVRDQEGQLKLAFVPQKKEWDYVISEITATFVRMITELDTGRLKRCDNPDCRSVFYDSSKNQTRKWCCSSCSSLIKVRRHRAKHKPTEILGKNNRLSKLNRSGL